MPSEESVKKDRPEIQISSESEMERLRRDVLRPDKFYLFTAMLRLNAMLKKAKIVHK